MKELCYGSVCSGIEAASIAGNRWVCVRRGLLKSSLFHLPFLRTGPCRQPWRHDKTCQKVPAGEIESPDVLVGEHLVRHSVSRAYVVGLMMSGALTLKYVELANAIDDKRSESFLKPTVIVWENVPESCHRQITPSDVSLPDWLEKMRHLNR